MVYEHGLRSRVDAGLRSRFGQGQGLSSWLEVTVYGHGTRSWVKVTIEGRGSR